MTLGRRLSTARVPGPGFLDTQTLQPFASLYAHCRVRRRALSLMLDPILLSTLAGYARFGMEHLCFHSRRMFSATFQADTRAVHTRKALPAGRQSPRFLGVAFFGYRNWRFRRSLDAPVKTRPRSERLSSSHRI